eukprot:715710_1
MNNKDGSILFVQMAIVHGNGLFDKRFGWFWFYDVVFIESGVDLGGSLVICLFIVNRKRYNDGTVFCIGAIDHIVCTLFHDFHLALLGDSLSLVLLVTDFFFCVGKSLLK